MNHFNGAAPNAVACSTASAILVELFFVGGLGLFLDNDKEPGINLESHHQTQHRFRHKFRRLG